MTGLVSTAEILSIRRDLQIVFVHTYTRTVRAGGSEDAWGEADPVSGTVTTGVPCIWKTREVSTRDAGGTTVVTVPTLSVYATDPLAVGDLVSAITGSDGVLLTPTVYRVERLMDAVAGLGASVMKVWELRGTQVSN